MIYYHVSNHKYKTGDIIKAGYYGGLVGSSTNDPQLSQFEQWLESIRQASTNNKNIISRLHCIFAFTDTSNADDLYRAKKLSSSDVFIYEIEALQGNCISEHNFKIISHFHSLVKSNMNWELDELAWAYWSGSRDPIMTVNEIVIESLIGCDARVTKIF